MKARVETRKVENEEPIRQEAPPTLALPFPRGARRLGVPGAATMGSMGTYWSTSARIEHFVTQVAVMTQLTAAFMTSDLSELATESEPSG